MSLTPKYAVDNNLDISQAMRAKAIKKSKIADIAQLYQQHYALPMLLEGGKRVTTHESGMQFQWDINYRRGTTVEGIGIGEPINIQRNDTTARATLEFTIQRGEYSISDFEIDFNRNTPEKLFDQLEKNRANTKMAFAEKLEQDWWSIPASATAAEKQFHGVFSWAVPGTSGTAGFNGGNPVEFGSGVGFDSDTRTAWKNWNVQYTNASLNDLYEEMKEAEYQIGWQKPISASIFQEDRQQLEIFTNYATANALVQIAEARHDDYQRELSPFGAARNLRGSEINKGGKGVVTFKGHDVMVVPILDANTYATDPVIFVDWGVLGLIGLQGHKFKESQMIRKTDQPDIMFATITSVMQSVCTNKRRIAILNK